MPENPFVSIDINGVSKLIKIGTNLGRSVKSNLKVGICEEHGGEAKSIKFVYKNGLNYVNCSP